jgi:hypothetical protein
MAGKSRALSVVTFMLKTWHSTSASCAGGSSDIHRMDQYWQHHDLKAKDLLFSDLTLKDLEISTNVVRNIPRMAETDSNEPFFGLDSGAVLP